MLRLRLRQLNPRSQSCPPHPASSKVHRRSLRREISQEIDLAETIPGVFQVIIRIYRNQRNFTKTFRTIGSVSARVSRMEGLVFFISLKTKTHSYCSSPGMEGHARAADVRLEKYFPGESFDLHPVRNFITEQ